MRVPFPIRIVFVALVLFLWNPSVHTARAESPAIPDGASLTITKRGKSPALIEIRGKGVETPIRIHEGEWDKVPKEFHAFLEGVPVLRPEASEAVLKMPFEVRMFGRNSSGYAVSQLADLEIKVDTSQAPESAEWAEKAKKLAEEWYPNLVYMLDYSFMENRRFEPGKSITIEFKPMDGVAHSVGDRVVISSKWIKSQPGDFGMVVHEFVHQAQSYRKRVPGWITEGIADYLRFFVYEKNGDRTCRVNPDSSKYTDSYRTTGAFFDWIVRNRNPYFISELNAVCRKDGLPDDRVEDVFKTLAGDTPEELWKEFVESLRKRNNR